jgi:hypothetical protein
LAYLIFSKHEHLGAMNFRHRATRELGKLEDAKEWFKNHMKEGN